MENKRIIKYTTDGKKVVVIGSLNSQETIVQEIFIIENQEVPSGENFVVKSLHDAPAISWKEKELAKLEERFTREQKEYEDETNRLRQSYRDQTNLLRSKLIHIGTILKEADESSFNTLVNYITGKINYIVELHWRTPKLMTMAEFHELYEDKLRLISIFGTREYKNGNLQYSINEYYDRSGSETKFFPFETKEDAFDKFKELILAADISDEIIALAELNKIELDAEKVDAFNKKQIENINQQIEQRQKDIDGYKVKLEKYN